MASLQHHGFKELTSDPCIYFKTTTAGLTLIAIYVDDILVAAKDKNAAAEIKDMLAQEYMITDLSIVERYLGIEIEQDPNDKSILLHQSAYIQQLLEKFGMENCSPKVTPMLRNLKLDPIHVGNNLLPEEITRYQSAVGGIMFLTTQTRPDIAFVTSVLSRFLTKPQEAHQKALQHLFRYLRGTTNLGIKYTQGTSTKLSLQGFTDSDHGGSVVTEGRRSTSGYIFHINDCPISWTSNRQTTVATSSSEAEYIGWQRGPMVKEIPS
jgi:reverse transcriptase-like protein